jgi:hypothetical protein
MDSSTDLKLKRMWIMALGREPGPDAFSRAIALAGSDGLEAVAWAVLNSAAFTRID